MKKQFGVPEGYFNVVTVRKDIGEMLLRSLNEQFAPVVFSSETEPDAMGVTIITPEPVSTAKASQYKTFVRGVMHGLAEMRHAQCPDMAPTLQGDLLLAVAFSFHQDHMGVFQGNNFVECAQCKFHVHVDPQNGDKLWKHWYQSYDRQPITECGDSRLR